MKLIRHTDVTSFLAISLQHLLKDEALNNLMLGICNRLKNDPKYYEEVYFATVIERDELVLAALMTIPEKLIVYGVGNENKYAIELLIKNLMENNIHIPGVIGPKRLVKAITAIWSEHIPCIVELDMHMRVYELQEVNKEIIGEGRLRLAHEGDLEFLVQAIADFQLHAGLNATPILEKCEELARRNLVNQSLFIWEHEGKAVSIAAKSRPTQNGVTINLVYTPSHLRNQGYATSCVAALSQHLLDSGYKFCSLFTDLANPISNSIYKKIGYQSRGDVDSYYIRYQKKS